MTGKGVSDMNSLPRLNLLPQKYRPHKVYLPNGGYRTIYPPISRFLSKVNKLGPIWNGTHCWMWGGHVGKWGYGRFSITHSEWGQPHTFAWAYFKGAIPSGFEIDHLCRNRQCSNPGHLEPVPPIVNKRRGNGYFMWNGRKTHCIHGHEFSPANTYTLPNNNRGWRACRECRKLKDRRRSKRSALTAVKSVSIEEELRWQMNPCSKQQAFQL